MSGISALKRQDSPGGHAVGSRPHSSISNLFDVVDDSEELPLGVHLASTAESEASHALVLQVGKDRFDGRHTPTGKSLDQPGYQTSIACVR